MSEKKLKKNNWLSIISYALFDAGNSAVGAIHATFIFAIYFVQVIAPENGSAYWGFMTAAAAICVAIIGPIMGGFADSNSKRKLFLFFTTLTVIISTFLLWNVKPDNSFLWIAIIFSFISILGNELMFVFYNSLLPSVASKENIGKVSGWSWGVGYFGAIIALIICLMIFILPEKAPFGLLKENSEDVRATMILASVWMLILSIPLFVFVKEKKESSNLTNTFSILKKGWSEIKKIPHFRRFLIARLFFADGLSVVFAFAGIFAAKVFGFTTEMVIFFAIAVNFTCGIGALLGGWFDDKFGSFLTIRISLVLLTIFGLGVLLSPTSTVFWILGLTTGLFIGPVQSASRSLVTRVSPIEHSAQIFGFYMLVGKITSFIGPLIYAILITWTGNERAGMVSAVIFFIMGFIILGKTPPGKSNNENL